MALSAEALWRIPSAVIPNLATYIVWLKEAHQGTGQSG
jgi:hypothetical protein